MSIIFKINGRQFEVTGKYGPDVSLNEFIRNVAELRGTKAMCHEGGCGICIVAVRAALPPTNEIRTFAVNSCLVSVLSCHGWEVTTVEGVGNRTEGYHDIQTRLAKFGGTQCGFCTPGWIMNMYSLHESKGKDMTMEEIENSFAGNICRCTGYRPIADAFKSFAKDADQKLLDKIVDLEDLAILKPCGVNCKESCKHKCKDVNGISNEEWCILSKGDAETIVVDCGTHKWYKVYKLEEIFKIMENGDYKLIAGNTGQGVYHVSKYPKNVIDIFNVKELKDYYVDVNLVLGAGITLSDMMNLFIKFSTDSQDFLYLKQLYDHMDLVAHLPVRNIGTIGGNLHLKYQNNEFPSDLFLLFETVGAMITIAQGNGKQTTVTFPEFLTSEMKGKIILSISLPPLSQYCAVKTFKIMPRSQNAHAVVNAGFLFQCEPNSSKVKRARIVYGNISKTFIHASKTEAILVGKDLYEEETLQLALKTVYDEVVPEDFPPEPSSDYRRMLAVTLFYKAILFLCPKDKVNPKYISGGEAMKRSTSHGTQIYDTDKTVWPVNQPIPKMEGLVQCSGEAIFANDLPRQNNEVFGAFVKANAPPGSIIEGFDISEASKLPGVIKLYSAKDIPGINNFTPPIIPLLAGVEEVLCTNEVKYFGQPAAIIVAEREKTAVKAAELVKVKYKSATNRKPLITIKDVLKSNDSEARIHKDIVIQPENIGKNVKHVIKGEFTLGSQYHFQMETQTSVVIPSEDGMDVYAATQWLDLTNVAIAKCLNISVNKVNVVVRRLGGAYGAKVTRATHIACAAAIVSHLQGKPCRFILPVETNMKSVGKRASSNCKYEIGVDDDGKIQYLKNVMYSDSGISFNENMTYLLIQFFKAGYDSKSWYMEGNSVITDTPSTTYCRAPCSTEGVAMIENMMEQIAFTVKKDSNDVRLLNIDAKDKMIPDMIEQLKKSSNFDERTEEIKTFNDQNRWRKRGLKLVPLTYELEYFGPFYSLVSIFHADGTVAITHSGIEMGQGINTKAAQVCAYVLGVPLEKVSVKPSSSTITPNAMVTGGSIGSDCIALSTMKACELIAKALEPIKKNMPNASWEEIVQKAYESGINLQQSYCFNNGGELKKYDIYAVCALEVEIDILTGNQDVRRVDLLEDTGRSLNPEIDVGQIEGSFAMGLGYWTSEHLVYDDSSGDLLTDRTWTYKPPGIKDIPADLRIYFQRNSRNDFGVLQSKATGEPAFCLATVIIHAIREAVRSARLDAGYKDEWFDMENPCTVENIFKAVGHKLDDFRLK
ncbi:xanthine dehydrogenase 1-like [Ostrinia furnacalis]|uniref:xanthine dehydrogenase 1-like n=1 Tax=Ostrinia furnacalis TaxID=93504 RepID=UPI00103B01D9|nr:xanthine dehydrogenase 1-like [Ostrinia furnacalis]